ncbi:MAG: histidine phosphatase family protein [Solirubrobacterales bacterium]|nr:histidine phosphatase family protein [Solirubrobacterales bacterium]
MTLVLLRHAETEWSANGRHTGRTDIPLLDSGRETARTLREPLAQSTFARVLTSPLSRASETAALAGFPDAEHEDGLLEWDYGEDEGLTTPQIRDRRPDWSLWRDGCPGGESPDDVAARCDAVIEAVSGIEGDVLLVSHGHVLRILAARWVAQPPAFGARLRLETGTLSTLGHERETRVILTWSAPAPRA